MGEKIVEIIIEMFEVAEWFENRPNQLLPPVALKRNQLVAKDTGKGESGRGIETVLKRSAICPLEASTPCVAATTL